MGKIKTGAGAAAILAAGFAAGTVSNEANTGPADPIHAGAPTVGTVRDAAIAVWPDAHKGSIVSFRCSHAGAEARCLVRDLAIGTVAAYESDPLALSIHSEPGGKVIYRRQYKGPAHPGGWETAIGHVRTAWGKDLGVDQIEDISCDGLSGSCRVLFVGSSSFVDLNPG